MIVMTVPELEEHMRRTRDNFLEKEVGTEAATVGATVSLLAIAFDMQKHVCPHHFLANFVSELFAAAHGVSLNRAKAEQHQVDYDEEDEPIRESEPETPRKH